MVEVHTAGVVARPAETVFHYAADYRRMNEWVFGITSVQPVGQQDSGLGAVFEGSVDLGLKTLSSRSEITLWEPGKAIALTSVSGFDFSVILRLESQSDLETTLDFELTFGNSGGATARALSRTIEPILALAARLTTDKLCKACLQATPDSRSVAEQ